MDIYVGKLTHNITRNDLQRFFEPFGEIQAITVITDKNHAQPKVYGFVKMPNPFEARFAIESLNGKSVKGRVIRVKRGRFRAEMERERQKQAMHHRRVKRRHRKDGRRYKPAVEKNHFFAAEESGTKEALP